MPSSSVRMNGVTGHPEEVPMELMSADARAEYALMTTARQLVSGVLFGGFFGLIAGAHSKRSLLVRSLKLIVVGVPVTAYLRYVQGCMRQVSQYGRTTAWKLLLVCEAQALLL